MLSLPHGAFLLILVPGLCAAQLEVGRCRSYEPEVVSLHGTLVGKTVAGPTNYQDIRKGDEGVKLDLSMCVNQAKLEPGLYPNPSQKNIRRLQLLLNDGDRLKATALLANRVVATGSLFRAHTGHDHTPVLLTVTYLELPRWQ
jgi:hypothetical protein